MATEEVDWVVDALISYVTDSDYHSQPSKFLSELSLVFNDTKSDATTRQNNFKQYQDFFNKLMVLIIIYLFSFHILRMIFSPFFQFLRKKRHVRGMLL
jgi:hypothetical protein